MGDETTQFASRFATAVELLSGIATEEGAAAARERLGPGLDAAVADALDAVAEVHGTGTDAVKDWAARRVAVLARVAELRTALGRGGVDATVRRGAEALVELVGARKAPAGGGPPRGQRRRA